MHSTFRVALALICLYPQQLLAEEQLPAAIENELVVLAKMKDAAAQDIVTLKSEITNGHISANEEPNIRLSYTAARKAADHLIDQIINDIQHNQFDTTGNSYKPKEDDLKAAIKVFDSTISDIRSRYYSDDVDQPTNIVILLEVIAFAITLIEFIDFYEDTKYTEVVVDSLNAARWPDYFNILPEPQL